MLALLRTCAVPFFLLGVASPAATSAQAPSQQRIERERREFDALLARAESELVPGLEELARWCKEHDLYRERDRVCRALVALDPEHSHARKVLRYVRLSGEWRQSSAYRVPRNHDEEALPQFEERLAAATAGFRATVFRELERGRRWLAPGTREDVLRRLLILDPDDVALRTVLGEVKLGDAWVLRETERAVRGRRDIGDLARASIDSVEPPDPSEPTDEERRIDLRWNAGRETLHVRVLGTTRAAEVTETTRVTEAVSQFFKGIFRRAQPHRRDFTIYLLRDSSERDRLLAGLAWLDDDTRRLLGGAGGGWLGKRNLLGEWDPDPERRLDGAARQTLGTLLMDSYGIDGRHGWAWEGIGLYLVHHLVGTRKTWFIDRDAYSRNSQTTLWPKLQAPETDWLVEARDLLAGETAPRLGFLLGRSVDAMRDEDLLAAYVLAAYLLEGRPDDVPVILERIGDGEHPVTVFEDVTGMAVPALDARLSRWLDEVLEASGSAAVSGTGSPARR